MFKHWTGMFLEEGGLIFYFILLFNNTQKEILLEETNFTNFKLIIDEYSLKLN